MGEFFKFSSDKSPRITELVEKRFVFARREIFSVRVGKSKAMEAKREVTEKKRKAELDNESEDDDVVRGEAQNPVLLSSIYNYLVVLSIILIIFAAFRNSVTW